MCGTESGDPVSEPAAFIAVRQAARIPARHRRNYQTSSEPRRHGKRDSRAPAYPSSCMRRPRRSPPGENGLAAEIVGPAVFLQDATVRTDEEGKTTT